MKICWGGVAHRLIDWIYPVGHVIATVNPDYDPNKLFKTHTWTRIAQGRVLMGADDNHAAGTTAAAGLPNITGGARPAIRDGGYPLLVDNANGALYRDTAGSGYRPNSGFVANTASGYKGVWINFDASRSNSIYGNSDTVQPPAYFIHYWQRTA